MVWDVRLASGRIQRLFHIPAQGPLLKEEPRLNEVIEASTSFNLIDR